jgi:mannose-6-phosphate isomerase-like protein (cupin superfamily)
VIEVGRLIEFPDEVSEIVATPETTGDRYTVIGTTPVGGGIGLKGFGPHTHPGLTEIFRCVSGTINLRVGGDLLTLSPGESAEVPPRVVHGFLNTGQEPLVVEVDLVFTSPRPRQSADLIEFAVILDGLMRDGTAAKRSGMPSLLQQAVLMRKTYPEALDQPGIGKPLIRVLAALGHLRRMPTSFPQYMGVR